MISYSVRVFLPTSTGGLSTWLEWVECEDLESAKESAFSLCFAKYKTAKNISIFLNDDLLCSRKVTDRHWTDHN